MLKGKRSLLVGWLDAPGASRLGETGTEKESEFSMGKLRVLFGKRSWFEGYDYIFLEPGERSRFSFVASLPAEATMVGFLSHIPRADWA
jgi:hypothetical protein